MDPVVHARDRDQDRLFRLAVALERAHRHAEEDKRRSEAVKASMRRGGRVRSRKH